MPPLKVLVSGAFQSDLRYPKFWHNSYMMLRIGFVKKKSKFFQKFFQFFSVFWIPFTHKKIFLYCGAKNYLLLYIWRATCPFDPQKMLFRGFFYKVSLKRPPWQYPDISEPGQGRVNQMSKSNIFF